MELQSTPSLSLVIRQVYYLSIIEFGDDFRFRMAIKLKKDVNCSNQDQDKNFPYVSELLTYFESEPTYYLIKTVSAETTKLLKL